jgi:hypothetical protein
VPIDLPTHRDRLEMTRIYERYGGLLRELWEPLS